jgi:Septum formation
MPRMQLFAGAEALWAVGLAVLLIGATSACTVEIGTDDGGAETVVATEPGESDGSPDQTSQATEPDRTFLGAVETGDCLGEELTQETTEVLVVPCSEEHLYEVYGEFSLPDGDYPGEDAITEDADAGCLDLFPDFVGLPYDESVLVMGNLYPEDDLWAVGHRVVQCLVFDPAGPVTGSLEGAAR